MSQQMITSGGTPLWEAFRVEDTFGPASIGGSNRIKRVWFHVLGADDTYVDVPAGDFTAPKVAALIEAHVAHLIDVLQLKGQEF